MGTVSKSTIISEVASDHASVTKGEATSVIDAFLDGIRFHTAVAGNKVIIQGFGTFEMKTRAAHTARNPGTGLPVEVPEQTRLTFKASKTKA